MVRTIQQGHFRLLYRACVTLACVYFVAFIASFLMETAKMLYDVTSLIFGARLSENNTCTCNERVESVDLSHTSAILEVSGTGKLKFIYELDSVSPCIVLDFCFVFLIFPVNFRGGQ